MKTKRPYLAPMEASIPRFLAWILRTAGQLVMKKAESSAPKKGNCHRIQALFFCGRFLNLLFSNFVPLRFRN
jgi:hypothetical protein